MKTAEQILNKSPYGINGKSLNRAQILSVMKEYAEQFKPNKLTVDDLEYCIANEFSLVKTIEFLNEKIGAI